MPGRAIDHEFMYDLPSLAAPRISPDGRHIAYVRSDIHRETYKPDSRVELVRAGGGTPRALTAGPRDAGPRWSPDGGSIAFVRWGDEEGARPQLWRIALDGGEATPLAELEGGVAGFVWTPDGRAIIAVSRVDPDAPDDDGEDAPPRARVVNGRIRYRGDGEGWFGAARAHLFRVDLEDGSSRQLTRGDHNHTQPEVSPDGATIAFVSSDRGSQRRLREPMGSELCLIPAEGGRVRRLVRNGWSIAGPAWSADGARIAYVDSERRESQRYLEVVEVRAARSSAGPPTRWRPPPGRSAPTSSGPGVASCSQRTSEARAGCTPHRAAA